MPGKTRGDHGSVIDKKLVTWLRNFGGVSPKGISQTNNRSRQARIEIHLEKSPVEIVIRQTRKIQHLTFFFPSSNPKANEPKYRKEDFWKKKVIANWILRKYQVVRYEFDTEGETVIKTEVNTEATDETIT